MHPQAVLVLSSVDHWTSQLKPISKLVDFIVTKIAPQTNAKACHPTHYCGDGKGSPCNGYYHCEDDCRKIIHYHRKIYYDDTLPQNCLDKKSCEDPNICDWWTWEGAYCNPPC